MYTEFLIIQDDDTEIKIDFRVPEKIDEQIIAITKEDLDTFSGEMTIGNETVHLTFKDTLPALIQNLCFNGVQQIFENEKATINFFSYYGQFEMIKNENEIKIVCPPYNSVTFEATPLLLHLYNTGKQFIKMVEKIQVAKEFPLEELIEHLSKLEVATREKLVAHNLKINDAV